jgi:hypothetical protein
MTEKLKKANQELAERMKKIREEKKAKRERGFKMYEALKKA